MKVLLNIPLTLAGDDNSITAIGERCRVAKAILGTVGVVDVYRMHLPALSMDFFMVLNFEADCDIFGVQRVLGWVCTALRQPSCVFADAGDAARLTRDAGGDLLVAPALQEEVIPWEPRS